MGKWVLLLSNGSGSNGESYLEINIDYHGKTRNLGNEVKFSSITTVVYRGDNGDKLCVWGRNGDDFWFPCSSLL